jgi:hypothetical protein
LLFAETAKSNLPFGQTYGASTAFQFKYKKIYQKFTLSIRLCSPSAMAFYVFRRLSGKHEEK